MRPAVCCIRCTRRKRQKNPPRMGVDDMLCKEQNMPKMKTKRSAAKRFSVTGSGKFRRRKQNLRHILTKKNAKRKMRLGQGAIVDSANEKAVRRMMPYA